MTTVGDRSTGSELFVSVDITVPVPDQNEYLREPKKVTGRVFPSTKRLNDVEAKVVQRSRGAEEARSHTTQCGSHPHAFS